MNRKETIATAISPEVDYIYLTSLLSAFQRPRQEISRLLEDERLVRVKKGLYVIPGHRIAHSKEILANLIYGPSCISLEYALSFHGLIPERVESVTSVTPNRNKEFTTPVGVFSYRYLSLDKYAIGVTQIDLGDSRYCLMASPEKALNDKIYFSLPKNSSQDALATYLYEDLRADEERLKRLSVKALIAIAAVYNTPASRHLISIVKGIV